VTTSAQPGERATAYSKVAVEDHHAKVILREVEELLQLWHAEAVQRGNEDQARLVLIGNTRLRTELVLKWEIEEMLRKW
jgi:hypothetical protein